MRPPDWTGRLLSGIPLSHLRLPFFRPRTGTDAPARRNSGPKFSREWRRTQETRLLMGTLVTVLIADADPERACAGLGRAFAEIERLRRVFDHRLPGAALSELNRAGVLRAAPEPLLEALHAAARFSALTNQAFNPTVKPVLDLWRACRNPEGRMRVDREEWERAAALIDPEGVRIAGTGLSLRRPGMSVTLDGIAKGYIADQAAKALAEMGFQHFLIDAGGDVRAQGAPRPDLSGWRVAIEDPERRNRYPARVLLSDQALATSGTYEALFDASGRRHHLIHPQTGRSPHWSLSVSVLAGTATEADALATGLAMLPPDEALHLAAGLRGRECLIVCPDMSIRATPGWHMV